VLPNTDFAPDPQRALEFDRRMHSELAASLRHVRDQIHDIFPDRHERLEALIRDLEKGTAYPPVTFGLYYDLVLNLLDNDIEGAGDILDALVETSVAAHGQSIIGLNPGEACTRTRLYRGKLMADMDDAITIEAAEEKRVEAFRERYARAFDLLESEVPTLAGEIRALVREVVPVVGGSEDTGTFEGASHYQLWGALFLNAAGEENRLQMAEKIAHESAHSLLFGFCVDEPLVHNDDDERYPSPLREDPRPMDGIFHATYVSARMHWTMSFLLDSGALDDDEVELARAARATDARNFADGDRVLREHAALSRHGAELIEGAREWMADHAR
jgi:hypothetical protein